MKILIVGDTFLPLSIFAEKYNFVLVCFSINDCYTVYFRGVNVRDKFNVRGLGYTLSEAIDDYTRRINKEVLRVIKSGQEVEVGQLL